MDISSLCNSHHFGASMHVLNFLYKSISFTFVSIILCLKSVPFIDITGLKKFKEVLEKYYHQGIKIYLCEANETLQRKFNRNGILQQVVGKRVFNSLSEAILFNLNFRHTAQL